MKSLKLHGKELVCGENSLQYLNEIELKRVFIVTGKGSMYKNGTIQEIISILDNKQSQHFILSGIGANPTTDEVLNGVEKMNEFSPETIIAVGGGSAIDACKVMALFYEYPNLNFEKAQGNILNYERKKTNLIAIPSTSGTGTEVTKAAVITFAESNIKIGLKSKAFIPDIAIIDGKLTLTMPKHVVAESGMDAMTHAVECFINKKVDDFTEILAKGAVEGLYKYLLPSFKYGDLISRQKVHNYQCIAGTAFTNVGLGMSHGISHAFGGLFGYSHGILNAVALPYVLEYNSQDPEVNERLKILSKTIEEENFIEEIKKLNKDLEIPVTFKDMGITEEEFNSNFDLLLQNSLKGSTRSNPIPMTKDEMDKVLKRIYYGKEY